MSRDTIIYQITDRDYINVFNRNSEDFEKIFYDIYVEFFDVLEPHDLYGYKVSEDIKIINILNNVSNYNNKDQKIINIYKAQAIADLQAKGYIVSNKNLNYDDNVIMNYRKYWYAQYKKIFTYLKDRLNTYNNTIIWVNDVLYEYIKNTYNELKNNNLYEQHVDMFNAKKYVIWNSQYMSDENKILFLITRKYLYDKLIDKNDLCDISIIHKLLIDFVNSLPGVEKYNLIIEKPDTKYKYESDDWDEYGLIRKYHVDKEKPVKKEHITLNINRSQIQDISKYKPFENNGRIWYIPIKFILGSEPTMASLAMYLASDEYIYVA